MRADVTIEDTLTVEDTVLSFDGSEPTVVDVAPDGRLDVTRSLLEETSTGSPFELRYRPGAEGTVVDTEVSSTAAPAIGVTGASVSLDNVTVRDASIGLHASDGAQVAATDSTLGGDNRAVDLVGDAELRHRNGSFDAPVQARLAETSAGAPDLVLEGTPYNASDIDFADGSDDATVESHWFAEVEVVFEDDWVEEMDTVEVTVKNRTDAVHRIVSPVREDNRTPVLRLPAEIFGDDGSLEQHNPRTITVRKDSSANEIQEEVRENRLIEIALPQDNDDEPPWWDGDDGLTDAAPEPVGYSSTGTLELAWNPATDGNQDNREVDHYELLHTSPDGEIAQLKVSGEATTVSDLVPGVHAFQVRPVDLVGNEGNWSHEHAVTVDRSPPDLTVTVDGTEGPTTGHYRSPVTLQAQAMDTRFEEIRFLRDGTLLQANGTEEATATIDAQATHNITVQAWDAAEGVTERQVNLTLDVEAPQLSVKLSPSLPTGEEGWYDRVPTMTLSALDDGPSGVHEIRYRSDGAANWITYDESGPLDLRGDHLLRLQAIDGAGNVGESQLAVAVDPDPPVVNLSLAQDDANATTGWSTGPVQALVEATDDAAGLDRLEYRTDDDPWTRFRSPLTLDFSGVKELEVRAVDVAGNPSDPIASTVGIDPSAPIPPQPRWVPGEDGHLEVDWSSGPPSDGVSGLSRATVEVAGDDGSIRLQIDVSVTESVQTVGPFPSGSHRFRVAVADEAGNRAATPWTEVAIADSVAGLTVLEDEIARGEEEIRYTPPAGFEPVEVHFYVDDSLVASTNRAPYTLRWDTTEYSDGAHTVEVVAAADDGVERTETRTYEVRNAYPATLADGMVPLTVTLIVAAAAVAGATLAHREWTRWDEG